MSVGEKIADIFQKVGSGEGKKKTTHRKYQKEEISL